jgi:hypothetical protein
MATLPLSVESSSLRDTHIAGEPLCPTCDQPVSPEKFEEIQERERERAEIVQREYARKIQDTEAKAQANVDKARKEAASAVEAAKREAVAREAVVREEAAKAVRAEMAPKFAEAEEAKKVAEQEAEKRLQEQREAYEKAITEAVNAEKANTFNHNQKLEEKVQQLQRQLQEKTAHELGEGAEINLFEELRRAFPGDQIDRVAKGVAGADIIHKVIMNRKECGTVVYDSKNRARWLDSYATKLRQDQLAAKADHAILSTAVFPTGAKQLHEKDGVILENPARVITMAEAHPAVPGWSICSMRVRAPAISGGRKGTLGG